MIELGMLFKYGKYLLDLLSARGRYYRVGDLVWIASDTIATFEVAGNIRTSLGHIKPSSERLNA